jgi:hypothetical protein
MAVDAQAYVPSPPGQADAAALHLQCGRRDGEYVWQTTPFHKPVTRFFTFDSEPQSLEGDLGGSRQSPDVSSEAHWIGMPYDTNSRCAVEQESTDGGYLHPANATMAPTGEPLSFTTVPSLFDMKLSGHCLWMLSWPR